MAASRLGTGYTNLQTYLGLNQSAAQNMARGIDDAVADEAQKYQQGLQGARNELEAGIAKSQLQDPGGVKGLTSQQAQQYANQGYTGPGGYTAQSMGNLTALANTAQNAARSTDTNEGRQTLLARKYGANTWGGSALDAALAGTGGASTLERTRGSFGRLADNLKIVEAEGAQRASAARAAHEARQKQYGELASNLGQQERAEKDAQRAAHRAKLEEERLQNRNNRKERPGAGYAAYP